MLLNNITFQSGVPLKRNVPDTERATWILVVMCGIWIGNVQSVVKGIGVIILLL